MTSSAAKPRGLLRRLGGEPQVTSSAAKPRGLLRRYGPDLAIIAATFAFVAVAGLLGLWLIHAS